MAIDDQLRARMNRSPVRPSGEDVTERVAAKRRSLVARRRAGAGALGIAIIISFAVASVMLALSDDPDTVVPTTPSSSTSPSSLPTALPTAADGTVRIEGVPYPVCRPMSIPGDFGSGLDTAWLFEAERVPGSGCIGSEGFPRIAIGTAEAVAAMSAPFRDYTDAVAPWPYATPDIDADGIDEIAIGIGGSATEGYARIVLFRITPNLDQSEIVQVVFDCGPDCDPTPWINIGTFVESLEGAYCSPDGFVRWAAGEAIVVGAVWSLEGDRLAEGPVVINRPDDGSGYPEDGKQELCGSPSHWPEEFPTYPDST